MEAHSQGMNGGDHKTLSHLMIILLESCILGGPRVPFLNFNLLYTSIYQYVVHYKVLDSALVLG